MHLLFPGENYQEGHRQEAWGTEKEPRNDVLPGEKMLDTNCHVEAGVFNNHTGVPDCEENCSLDGPTPFYKGKTIFDQNLIKSSAPFTGIPFVFQSIST